MNNRSSLKRNAGNLTPENLCRAFQKNLKKNKQTHNCKELEVDSGMITPIASNLSVSPIASILPSYPKVIPGILRKEVDLSRLVLEVDKASEVLAKMCKSSWWEWDDGSALFFWRWGEESS